MIFQSHLLIKTEIKYYGSNNDSLSNALRPKRKKGRWGCGDVVRHLPVLAGPACDPPPDLLGEHLQQSKETVSDPRQCN